MADEMHEERGSVPSPDPTVLTSQALYREVGALKETLTERIAAVDRVSEERFKQVAIRLDRMREHRLEAKEDSQKAVEAALESQREATVKSETAIEKQIAEIKANERAALEAIRREFEDFKENLRRLEGRLGRVEFGPPPSNG